MSVPAPFTTRPAGPGDAAEIAAVHLASWRAAYRDDAPAGFLQRQTLEGRTAVWQDRLAPEDRGAVTDVVVDCDGAIAGFCHMARPGRGRDAVPGTAEIDAFYIDPARFRTGAGRTLMTAALARLREAGAREVTLWVLHTNARARAFYATVDFADDGGRLTEGDWPVQLRLRRRFV